MQSRGYERGLWGVSRGLIFPLMRPRFVFNVLKTKNVQQVVFFGKTFVKKQKVQFFAQYCRDISFFHKNK